MNSCIGSSPTGGEASEWWPRIAQRDLALVPSLLSLASRRTDRRVPRKHFPDRRFAVLLTRLTPHSHGAQLQPHVDRAVSGQ